MDTSLDKSEPIPNEEEAMEVSTGDMTENEVQDTTIDEPNDQDTTIDEPVDQDTTIGEQNDQDTTIDEPNDQDTTTDEPVDQDTTIDEPNDQDTTSGEPVDQDTTIDEPNDEDTTIGEPVDQDTTVGEQDTTIDEPNDQDTTIDEPNDQDTTIDKPVDQDATIDKPVDQDATIDGPNDQDTTIGEPVDQDTTISEPVDQDTTIGEPVDQDTTVGEQNDQDTTIDEPVDQDTTIDEPNDQDTTTDEQNDTTVDVDVTTASDEPNTSQDIVEETMEESHETDQNNTSVVSTDIPVKRKRGRPPKKKLKMDESLDDSSTRQEEQTVVEPMTTRRRGRPPKSKVAAKDDKVVDESQDESIGQNDVSNEEPNNTSSINNSSTPRKRGRPPKAASKEQPPKKRGKQKAASKEQELFNCIFDGKSAIQSVVSEWVNRYQNDPEAAMLELIQYFVRCSGCHAVISPQDFHNEEATTIIRKLTENFAEESFDYPLVMSGPQFKRFKSNYSEFAVKLIEGCGESILFDEFMLDSLVMWLVGLTDSQVRAFRHTSTLAALKLVTGLIAVTNRINGEIDNTQRQCETERRKSAPRRATGKLSKLEESLSTLQQQSVDLHDMINILFTSVFVHRYRDTRPEIRSICISELGVWMKEYSSQFLSNSYVKYIGWTLCDKVAEVRLQSLLALEPLYATPEFAPHLELFTTNFKERFVSMRLDKEDNVAVNAIELASHLLSLDMLDAEECVEICELVFMENRHIARASGKFAVQYLFSEDFVSRARRVKPPKGHKKPTDAHIKIRELLRFFLEVRIHNHTEYIVDSLWEHTDVLQDWETIIDMLTNSTCGIVLTNEEETALIEVLSCSVRRAAGTSLVYGKSKLSAKDKKLVESDKESLAQQLIPVISELIAKYGTDANSAANLTNIPQNFELEFFVELRAQKHLEDLLVQLKELIQKHSATEVLQEISATYCHLLDTDFTLHSVVNVSFGQLVDELFATFKECMDVLKDQSMMDDDNEELFNLSVTLKRISSLFKQINLVNWSSTDDLLHLVEMGIDGNASDMIVIPSLTCVQVHLLWSLSSIDSTKPDRAQLRHVRNLTETLAKHCTDLVKLGSPPVQQEAFIILCDLLIIFAKQLSTHGQLGSLVYIPSTALQSTLSEYVMEKVFSDTEIEDEPTSEEEALAQAEKLNDRRVLLSGYLKLVIYSVVDINSALSVLAQYFKFFSDYGDLIRTAITRTRESDPVKWYKAMLQCLKEQFDEIIQTEGDNTINYTVEFANLKDLAKRIALTLGFDLIKWRIPVFGIIHDGIRFALQQDEDADPLAPPTNLLFLQVISEFLSRLLDNDRPAIFMFLKKQFDDEHPLHEVANLEGWEEVNKFIKSIAGPEMTEAHNITTGGGKKGGRGTKRKATEMSTTDAIQPTRRSLRRKVEE